MNLLEVVTDKGKTYFVNGKRVSRLAYIAAKDGKRLDCFVTRVSKEAVRNYCTAHTSEADRPTGTPWVTKT